MIVFCYGTLKQGFHNHILLSRSKFCGEARTKPKYKLYDCGPYPCMVKSENGKQIKGELYEVNEATLEMLDRLEGVPYLYKRAEIELEDRNVTGYLYQLDVTGFQECEDQWPRK